MKKLILIVFILLAKNVFAQTDFSNQDTIPSPWKKSLEAGANINQSSFSPNWKGGGVNSIAMGLLLDGRLLYESSRISFDNVLQLQYGMVKNGNTIYRKTTDKIFFDSKLGYRLTDKWNAYISVNFLSQFAQGFKVTKDSLDRESQQLISRFMAPGYLTSSMGLEYKPVDYFWIRFGVGSFRNTFVTDTTLYKNVPLNYGVPIGKKVRNELAFALTANFDKDIAKNLHLYTRYAMFANYENLKAIDSRLDLTLSAKVNRYINVNLTATALYDQDQDYEIQYTQMLSLGLLYRFSEFDPKK